jgi:hypothetical protein
MSDWIRKAIAACDSMNIDEFLALHTEDVRFRIGNNETLIGREALRHGVEKLWSSLKSMSHDITAA